VIGVVVVIAVVNAVLGVNIPVAPLPGVGAGRRETVCGRQVMDVFEIGLVGIECHPPELLGDGELVDPRYHPRCVQNRGRLRREEQPLAGPMNRE